MDKYIYASGYRQNLVHTQSTENLKWFDSGKICAVNINKFFFKKAEVII